MTAVPSVLGPVKVLGRYALYDEIASGGMATVHVGRLLGPVGFARTVAIKRMHRHLTADPEFVSMFLEEARLAARVQHPNVVATLDVVTQDGELFHVMEYVDGESLSRLLRQLARHSSTLPLPVVGAIFSQALYGLHAAHEARGEDGRLLGIVHRDVSPENILVGRDGTARVLDFGVAKATERGRQTQGDMLKGKIAYMAPEQITGEALDRRADIYAAATVLWEALTGARLHGGGGNVEVLYQVIKEPARPPSSVREGLPREIDAVVLRGLGKDRQARYATAKEMAIEIERVLGVASPSVVGALVESIVGEALAKRSARIKEIESQPTELRAQSDLDVKAILATSQSFAAHAGPTDKMSGGSAGSAQPQVQAQAVVWPAAPPAARAERAVPVLLPDLELGSGPSTQLGVGGAHAGGQRTAERHGQDVGHAPARVANVDLELPGLNPAPAPEGTPRTLAYGDPAPVAASPAPAAHASNVGGTLSDDLDRDRADGLGNMMEIDLGMGSSGGLSPNRRPKLAATSEARPRPYKAASADARFVVSPGPRSSAGGGSFMLLVFVVLALAVGGVAAFFLWRKPNPTPRVATSTAAASATPSADAEAQTACENARKRVMQNAKPTGIALDGWRVELWLYGAAIDRAATERAVNQALTGKLKPTDTFGVPPTLLVGTATIGPIEEGASAGSVAVRFSDNLGRAALEPETAGPLAALANLVFSASKATAGALFARCAHLEYHDVGVWFGGKNEAHAVAALVYTMGAYSEAPVLDKNALMVGSMDPASEFNAILDRTTAHNRPPPLAETLERVGATVRRKPAVTDLYFPPSQPARATSATRSAAEAMGIGTR